MKTLFFNRFFFPDASATSQILYRYTFAGTGTQSWHAQFTYNGFRYLQVTGLAAAPTTDTVTVLVTHASNRETATFSSSDATFNSIYAITKQALENNMQSVLTDCPDREKGPYTGDNLHNIDTELTLFDMQAYQGQLVNNMRTAQRPVPANGQFPGMIANIAPEYHFVPPSSGGTWFLDEPNWGGAVIMIPWNLYEVYGDTAAMRVNYDAMVKWLDWEATTKAAEMRAEVDDYVDRKLANFEIMLAKTLKSVERGRAKLAGRNELAEIVERRDEAALPG